MAGRGNGFPVARDGATRRLEKHMSDRPDFVIVGRISSLYGVHGWVKIYSYTDPRENILRYVPWQVHVQGEWGTFEVAEGRRQGKGVVARLAACRDGDAARQFLGAEIAVRREQLPTLEPGGYYWTDLMGLTVVTGEGAVLGTVDHLLETGANDVLVVTGTRERLIPYVPGSVIRDVDLEHGVIRVDWDPEF